MPSRYGGLGFGRGRNVDPEKARERAQKAAAARWADPKQHEIQAEALRGKPGHTSGRHAMAPGQQSAMQEGRRAKYPPGTGPTKRGPQEPYKRRETPVPKAEEHALRREAREKFPNDEERQDAYVYGTMRKQGWKPEHHSPWDGKTYKHWWFGKMKV